MKEGRVFQNFDFPNRGTTPSASSPWASLLALIGFVGLCQLVGAAAAAVTVPSVRTWYLTLTAPPGTPPNWVFAPVWTTLYLLIGVSAWLVWRQAHRRIGIQAGHWGALRLWGWQLLAAAAWTPAFFGAHSPRLGLAVIGVMLVLIGCTIRAFARLNRLAAWLLAPYLAWTCYATYLNIGFWWLNPA